MTDRPDRPTRESMSPEEATISNMWEIAAIVEVLERKGVCTKQDLLGIITELRKTNPRAKIPETAFPEPYLLTETENRIIDEILALLNKNGLTSLAVLLTWGCASRVNEVMQSWVGKHQSDLIQAWGPRQQTASDGKGGSILIYNSYVNLGQTPDQATSYSTGYATYTTPQQQGYQRTRMFFC